MRRSSWTMLRLRQICCFGLFCLAGGLLLPPFRLQAQDAGSKAGQLWLEAQNAFNTGDYAHAATVLQSIIKSSAFSAETSDGKEVAAATPNEEWLEPVFFM